MQDWIIYDKKEIKDRQLFLQFHGETDSLTANGKLRIIALFTYADQKRYFSDGCSLSRTRWTYGI